MTMNTRKNLFAGLLSAAIAVGTPGAAWSDVLVFGGTGQLGARVVKLMLEADEDVIVFARPTSDRSRLAGLDIDYAVGDMMNDADVAAALESGDIDTIVIAVRAPLSVTGFYAAISDNVARHAKTAGVEQIIYHGAVGAGDNMAMHPDVPWESIPGLVARMEGQGQAEETFLASGIDMTIIRNSRVWPDSTPSTGQAELTEDQSTMTPMTRADLALFTMECFENSACAGKIYHVRDPSLTWPSPEAEAAEAAREAAGE